MKTKLIELQDKDIVHDHFRAINPKRTNEFKVDAAWNAAVEDTMDRIFQMARIDADTVPMNTNLLLGL